MEFKVTFQLESEYENEENNIVKTEVQYIKFGENEFKEWTSVIEYLFKKENISLQNQMF
jgi:predicted HTH domain antitoxin